MHFFRNRNRPRSSFDIQVGRFHLLEVTVHLVTHRRDASHRKSIQRKKSREVSDPTACGGGDEWDWYNTNREEINREFLELLEASVLSRMFGKELEDFHRKTNPSILQQEHDEIGGIASKNKSGCKRKRKGNTAVSKRQQKTKQKGLVAIAANNKDDDDDDDEIDKKPDKDIYFSFGELVQLAYKKQPIRDHRSTSTILFQSNHRKDALLESSENERANQHNAKVQLKQEAGSFNDRKKLSHRLFVWIGKSDASASASEGGDNTVTSRPGEGLYRSEMIPISSLFRKPKELMGLSDDDEDD